MISYWCSLLITTLYWQHVTSRHIVQHPFHPPYPIYDDVDVGPYHHSFLQHHSPFFSPPGTYFDQRQGILRPFPGGGVPVLVDYNKRCSDNFIGLRAHPGQQQYYYVCKPDCVIFGKCQNLQVFNATNSQCAQHPPPEYIPTCPGVGRFPLFTNCHLYYKCDEDLEPEIYSCPNSMIFAPAAKKCIEGNKCTPTKISPQSSYIPEVCGSKFPPCFENGTFRSPSDCSLYYKCDLKSNGVYMQTRLKCAEGNFYDLKNKTCLPTKEVSCDCIQVTELVYPKQSAVYPAQYDMDSIVDGQYPVEDTNYSTTEIVSGDDTSTNGIVGEPQATGTTTFTPLDSDEKDVFSDYIDIVKNDNESLVSDESDESFKSSEEADSEEGSGFESGSKEVIADQTTNANEDDSTTVTAATTEEITEPTTTINTDTERTDKPLPDIEDEEVLSQAIEKMETSTMSRETETTEGEAVTSTTDSGCNNDTQSNKCLTKHISTSLNTDTESKKNTTNNAKRKTEQISATLTITTTTPDTSTTKQTATTESLLASQLPSVTVAATTERDNLKGTTSDSIVNLTVAGTTGSSEKIKQTNQQLKAVIGNLVTESPRTTTQEVFQTTQNTSSSGALQDIFYEDVLESELIKKTNVDFSESKSGQNDEPDKRFGTSPESSESSELQGLEQTLSTDTLINEIFPQATTKQIDSAVTSEKLVFKGTTEQSTDDEPLKEEDAIEKTDSAQLQENFNENLFANKNFFTLAKNSTNPIKKARQENISTNEKSVMLTAVDLIAEDFIAVQNKSQAFNEVEEETTISEKGFDDDYTTILAEEETMTTSPATIPPEILTQNGENNDTMIKRRQTFLNQTAMQTTTLISAMAESLTNSTEQPNNDNTTVEEIARPDEESDEFKVLDSEIVVPPAQDQKTGDSAEEEEVDEEKQPFSPASTTTTPLTTTTQTTTTTTQLK